MAQRRCSAKAKTGKRCLAAPLKGSKYCSAHDPKAPDETRFGSPQQAARAGASEKPRSATLTELIQAKVAERAEELLAVYFELALHSENEFVRLKAADSLWDRAAGKPRQVTELAGEGGGAIQVSEEAFADPKLREALREAGRRLTADR